MASRPYPIRLTDEQRERLNSVATAIDLPAADTLRKALDLGLPVLLRRLTRSRTRATQTGAATPQ